MRLLDLHSDVPLLRSQNFVVHGWIGRRVSIIFPSCLHAVFIIPLARRGEAHHENDEQRYPYSSSCFHRNESSLPIHEQENDQNKNQQTYRDVHRTSSGGFL